jgi:hypothetical protein
MAASSLETTTSVPFTLLGELEYYPPCEVPCLLVIRNAKSLHALGSLWQASSNSMVQPTVDFTHDEVLGIGQRERWDTPIVLGITKVVQTGNTITVMDRQPPMKGAIFGQYDPIAFIAIPRLSGSPRYIVRTDGLYCPNPLELVVCPEYHETFKPPYCGLQPPDPESGTGTWCYAASQVRAAERHYLDRLVDPSAIVTHLTGLRLRQIVVSSGGHGYIWTGQPSVFGTIRYVFGTGTPALTPAAQLPPSPTYVEVVESVGTLASGHAFLQRDIVRTPSPPGEHTPWIWQSPIHDQLHALAVAADAPAMLVERLGKAVAAVFRAVLAKPEGTQLHAKRH